ncbi:MAG: M15 family metallopeptidase [Actinomycetota bacterium]|nr:M15 family metallopeptidase [Actinomycetota bacterium]
MWPRASTILIVLFTLLPVAGGTAMLVREKAKPEVAEIPTGTGQAIAPPAPPALTPVRPALAATFPNGVPPEAVKTARGVPGVAAAARVLLANLTFHSESGPTEVTVAAVEPEEFRPLAPPQTAAAEFVWEGLDKAQTFIAHEQFQMFGGKRLTTLTARGPTGTRILPVGGLATNGVPNLGGALISLQQAHLLGLEQPRLLIVGLQKGAKVATVERALERALPGAKFERMQSSAPGRSFFVGQSAQRAIGSFRFITNEDGTITQDSRWVASHIVRRRVPILGSVNCHRVMIPQLEGALREIEQAGLSHLIKVGQYGGCYVPRFIGRDKSKPISMHAWGLAVDINVAENLPGRTPKMDPRIVAIFESWGFRWGGRWSTPDGHHFELAALMRR